MSSPPPEHRVEHLLRELTPQVLGAVVRRYRDFAAGEDAVQEALIAAASQWPSSGIPDNQRGWLIQVAMRLRHALQSDSVVAHQPISCHQFTPVRHHRMQATGRIARQRARDRTQSL